MKKWLYEFYLKLNGYHKMTMVLWRVDKYTGAVIFKTLEYRVASGIMYPIIMRDGREFEYNCEMYSCIWRIKSVTDGWGDEK